MHYARIKPKLIVFSEEFYGIYHLLFWIFCECSIHILSMDSIYNMIPLMDHEAKDFLGKLNILNDLSKKVWPEFLAFSNGV